MHPLDIGRMHRFVNRRTLPVIFLGATVLGIFSTFQAYNYVSLFTEKPQPFPMLLGLNVIYWYAWALLVPGVLWLARRYRFERHTWTRALAVHVPASSSSPSRTPCSRRRHACHACSSSPAARWTGGSASRSCSSSTSTGR